MILKTNALHRATLSFVLIFILSSCATQKSMEQVTHIAQKAMTQSNQALQQAKPQVVALKQTSQIALQSLTQSDKAIQQSAHISRLLKEHVNLINKQLATISKKQDDLQQHQVFIDNQITTDLSKKSQKVDQHTDFMQQFIERTRKSAKQPYQPLKTVPSTLTELSYERYSKIQFKGKVPNWPMTTKFLPRFYSSGYLFHKPVDIYLLRDKKAEKLKFKKSDFNFDSSIDSKLPEQIPLAGFSLYFPFKSTIGLSEFLSFQGASYFRVLGSNQTWGTSARGIAIDTAIPHLSEEFPLFKSFWIVSPVSPESKEASLTFFAELDSPSMTGAYRFIVRPGKETVMNVKMVLFARKDVKRLGIAPLSSMYLQDCCGSTRYAPLSRSIHDSQGLSIESGDGHWLWLPLSNPKKLVVQQQSISNIKGFGLMQRSRNYRDYLAYGMNYQKRPSVWITPTGGDWGKGNIVLAELPTNNETNDNITTFWVPDQKIKPGKKMTFDYQISWQGDNQTLPPIGHTTMTRHSYHNKVVTYLINFRGGDLDLLPNWISLKPIVQISGPAKLNNAWVTKTPETNSWRLEIQLTRTKSGPVSIKSKLAYKSRILTETWKTELPAE
jgi:glucans biosynthesis protein